MNMFVIRFAAYARSRLPLLVAAGLVLAMVGPKLASSAPRGAPAGRLQLKKEDAHHSAFFPLERVTIEALPKSPSGLRLVVRDAMHTSYVDAAQVAAGFTFRVQGALGPHRAELFRGSQLLASETFEVRADTQIDCSDSLFQTELRRLGAQVAGLGGVAFVDGRSVRHFSTDLRQSRYASLAGRYFEATLQALPDIFLQYQKESGLVFSSMHADTMFDPYAGTYPGAHLARDTFGEGYTGRSSDGRWVFERAPTQADVESLLVAWVHDVWQASGDDAWMAQALPSLAKALDYLRQDPLRWSSDLGLIKRAFTLDVMNHQNHLAMRIHPRGAVNRAGWFDGRWVDKDSPMGITHGDNTAFYEAATLLARMYAHQGHDAEAAQWTAVAERVRENLNKVSWNGSFYRHHVRLAQHDLWKDLQTNESRQLSMSNPLAITRGAATHAQAVSIISEYQRRKQKLGPGVLAEWTTMDPPFRGDFGGVEAGSNGNGAVSPVVGGPLAHAAFMHGFEAYGVDVLRRVLQLQRKHGRLYGFYAPTPRPGNWQPETFSHVDLRTVANRHLRGDKPAGFVDHPENDLRTFPVGSQTFLGKPFDVIDPKDNGGRAALVLWGAGSPGPRETTVAGIGKKAQSIYFLHSAGNIGRQARVGEYIINYADGTKVRIPLVVGRNISSWWSEGDAGEWRLAWRGRNPHVSVVGMGVWGWDNKQADKLIDSITIRASGQGRVQLLGISLSSAPVQYDRDEVEGHAFDPWAAGVVYAAGVEGLAGVVDRGRVFEHVALSPRWVAANETRASVSVRYPSSRGYVAYRWEHRPGDRSMAMTFTGSGKRFDFHVLMPLGAKPREVTLDGKKLRHRVVTVEQSVYADFSLEAVSSGQLEIGYAPSPP